MQVPLQITFHNLEGTELIKNLIAEKATWLERYHDHLIACRVVVEKHRHRQQGNPYQVHIDLTLPGDEIAVNRESSSEGEDNLASLIRDAFDVVRRQLDDHNRRRRHPG